MSRSSWKNFFIEKGILKQKKEKTIKVWSRSSTIPNSLLGKSVLIYNGIIFRPLNIKQEHIGFKFGEFSFTCKKITKKNEKKKNTKKKR